MRDERQDGIDRSEPAEQSPEVRSKMRLMHAGLLPSMHLESNLTSFGNPSPIQTDGKMF